MTRLLLFFLSGAALFAADPFKLERGPGASYEPLTNEERWDFYWKRNFASPGAYGRSFGSAIGGQIGDNPPEWDGVEGYFQRVGSQFASFTVQASAESAGAALLRQDPRYVPCPCEGTWKRVGHALTSSFLTYNNNGSRAPAPARLGGFYAGSMVQLAWLPDRFSWKDGLRQGSQSIAFSSGFNLIREFWPEIQRVLPFKFD